MFPPMSPQGERIHLEAESRRFHDAVGAKLNPSARGVALIAAWRRLSSIPQGWFNQRKVHTTLITVPDPCPQPCAE
jgi:hypothetical protein